MVFIKLSQIEGSMFVINKRFFKLTCATLIFYENSKVAHGKTMESKNYILIRTVEFTVFLFCCNSSLGYVGYTMRFSTY